MAVLPYSTVLLIITFSAIPMSRSFQWWSPPSWVILAGSVLTLLCLPVAVRFLARGSPGEVNLATFFSIFVFASAIDVIVSLENDGILANYMSFYLSKGEPYLGTAYSTAICYWDGIVHFLLYWAMLHYFSKGKACFRAVGLYWFGSFFISCVILMLGTLIGPFPVYPPILLNLPYVLLPVFFLCWLLSTTKPLTPQSSSFSTCAWESIVQGIFIVFFICSIGVALLKGLIALGADREIFRYYENQIEQPINHAHGYGRITSLVYAFYGLPFYVYALFCLVRNKKSPGLVDASLLYAGVAANAQVGYTGPYLRQSEDYVLEFAQDWMWWAFWITNATISIVPHIFAFYCYQPYVQAAKRKSR
ncbi:transmembrane 6 superfamily member 1-like [Watersipora subatra]|uniref:transmembrane 6 superfamily member 1-like n=1 Tax=Watersipora subatra TaxID=2589382 RepID=UPI00355B6988